MTSAVTVFDYELEEAKANLQNENINTVSLLPFSVLFSQAIKNGFLQDSVTIKSIENWINNPRGWGKRHGF